jgi:hypothetical protein
MARLQATVLVLFFIAGAATPIIRNVSVTSQQGQPPSALSKEPTAATPGRKSRLSAHTSKTDLELQPDTTLGRLEAWLRRKIKQQGPFRHGGIEDQEVDELSFLVWSLPAADYPRPGNSVKKSGKTISSIDSSGPS